MNNQDGREERVTMLMQLTDPPLTRTQAEEVDDLSIHAADAAGEALLNVVRRLPPELQLVGNWAALMATQAKVSMSIEALDAAVECQCPACSARRRGEAVAPGGELADLLQSLGIIETLTPTKH